MALPLDKQNEGGTRREAGRGQGAVIQLWTGQAAPVSHLKSLGSVWGRILASYPWL